MKGSMGTVGATPASAASTTAALSFTGISTYSSDFQAILQREDAIAQLPITALQNAENLLLRKVSPMFLSPEDWRRKAAQKGSFVSKVGALPKIFIFGSEKDLQT